MMDEYAYMDALIDACREKGYTDVDIQVIGTVAGCEESYNVYGSTQKAFEAATEFIKQSSSADEAISKFVKTIDLSE